ncbi:MAG: FAD:protein FMN transferase [Thermomicrobiales bacterium]|nr:FAD:protein FMN transferase [Thermomicrobiales bacterium]
MSGVASSRFRAMSVDVVLIGVGLAPGEVARAAETGARLADWWEDRFSRFRPESDLCRMNAANGIPVSVEPATIDLIERAVEAVARSGGRFDPSILPALEAAGYRQSWAERATWAAATFEAEPAMARPAAGVAGWSEVTIDRQASTAALPPGMRIDFGGIAKGAFVDLLAEQLADWPGGAVDAGGDLVAWGEPPDAGGWTVGIEDPRNPDADLLMLTLPPGTRTGVATSGTTRRRWATASGFAHHLIDPTSGRSLSDAVATVTAVAATATAADVAAKTVAVAIAAGAAPNLLDAAEAFVAYADGRTRHFSRHWEDDRVTPNTCLDRRTA